MAMAVRLGPFTAGAVELEKRGLVYVRVVEKRYDQPSLEDVLLFQKTLRISLCGRF